MAQKLSAEAAKNKRDYTLQYAREKLKRIPLDVQKNDYEKVKAAADRQGETVSGYIKRAVAERMRRDGLGDDDSR